MTSVQDYGADPRAIFARQNNCKVCADETLTCPNCPSGQQCQITVQSCTQCASAYCTASPSPTALPSSSSGANVGVIAGGVVGGVAALAVVTFLVWRFCVKTKRRPEELEIWEPEIDPVADEREKSFAARRDQRASTHTVGSIASTVLTRASNIIQIAYIPGVTNRATPTSPHDTLLVPPVPPIPIGTSPASSPAGTEEQHFFVPGDLRDSTYSGLSAFSDRTSYARTSYAPRSSVASTIYGKNAVILAPVQTGMRAKPAVVSVKSAGSPSMAPPVPSVDYEKYSGGGRPVSPANSTFSVGSTFLNSASASTAVPVRPNVVRVTSGSSSKKFTVPESPELPAKAAGRTSSTVRDSNAVTIIEEEPNSADQGPFSDPAPSRLAHQSTTSLSAVIEEAETRRTLQRLGGSPLKGRENSPFGDEHATQEQ